jgi:hypothetical protein
MDHQQGSIFKINRSMNTTADVLARQAYRVLDLMIPTPSLMCALMLST